MDYCGIHIIHIYMQIHASSCIEGCFWWIPATSVNLLVAHANADCITVYAGLIRRINIFIQREVGNCV